MMDFQLTSEQEMFRDSLRRTLEGFGARASGPQLRKALIDLGATLTDIPEELGGFGGQGVETSIVLNEFGRLLITDPFTSSVVYPGALLTATNASHELLESLMDGSRMIVVASAEAEGGGDPLQVMATAEPLSAGYLLHGRKSVVIGASQADTMLVTARLGDDAPEKIALFRVDEIAGDRLFPCETLDGYNAADISLDGLIVPADALLADDCTEALARATDAALIATCAEAVGAMQAALDLTNDYLKTRKQFGVTIGSFQALQHRMADAFVLVEQARSSFYAALSAWAGQRDDRGRVIAASKALIGRTGKAMSADMIQLHGGIGMTEEYDIGHYHKRLLAIEARFGNSDHHLRRVASL